MGVTQPQDKECLQLPEARISKEGSSPRTIKGRTAQPTPGFLLFYAIKFVVSYYGSPRKLVQPLNTLYASSKI